MTRLTHLYMGSISNLPLPLCSSVFAFLTLLLSNRNRLSLDQLVFLYVLGSVVRCAYVQCMIEELVPAQVSLVDQLLRDSVILQPNHELKHVEIIHAEVLEVSFFSKCVEIGNTVSEVLIALLFALQECNSPLNQWVCTQKFFLN